ncbi:MAG: shikimate kinase [Chlamydiota bacterium]|nr:shikimate kinase [Chlamydiota bacterium]
MTNIILCGFHASGKTTVGQALAKQLNKTFVDTDALIEEKYRNLYQDNKSCREIYQQHGEEVFREIEKSVIESLPIKTDSVIALGGGTLTSQSNQERIKKMGTLIYLNTKKAILLERISKNGVPSFLQNASFDSFFEERTRSFKKLADFSISVENRSPDDIAEEINLYLTGVKNG